MPTFVHPDRAAEPALVKSISTMAAAVGREAFIRQQHAVMGRVDSRPDLPGIDVPTMVLCGREDAATPLFLSEEIAKGIPEARLCVVEECGHMSPMERPHVVTALMRDWLLR
jgi:pimeloyl-ACP methyl ester carboxylesterase